MEREMDAEIVVLEDRLTAATRGGDIAVLDGLYADDIIFTGVTGAICDKKAVMDEAHRGLEQRRAAAAAPAAAVVSYGKDDLRTARYGATAVASFRFSVTIGGDGELVTRHYRTTNVWVRRDATWQVAAAHTTMMA